MSPLARDFTPDPRRPGWSRCALERGELRAETESLALLEQLGLLDLERWRREELGGVTLDRARDHWVRCLPAGAATLFAKYRRGARRAEWFEELLHGRRPRSSAQREEQSIHDSAQQHGGAPHLLLAGEVVGALGVERESFVVAKELVQLERNAMPWEQLAPPVRAWLRGWADPPLPAPQPQVQARLWPRQLLARSALLLALLGAGPLAALSDPPAAVSVPD